jgi:hypothetical protein
MQNTNWMYFPKSNEPGEFIRKVVHVFQAREEQLTKETENLTSNQVLAILRPGRGTGVRRGGRQKSRTEDKGARTFWQKWDYLEVF